MSVSIIILKEIEGFSCQNALRVVQRAAGRAGMHCLGVSTYQDENGGLEYLEGTLSEADADTLQANFKRGVPTRQCGFSIEKPTDSSYDSFTWLIHRKDYFWALDLQYLGGDFAFAFQFLAQYFQFEENRRGYLWIDDTDWFYSAEDMLWLSRQPYQPAWHYKKLTTAD